MRNIKGLAFVGTTIILALWLNWPKSKPLPRDKKDAFFMYSDIQYIFSDSLYSAQITPLDSVKYTETSKAKEPLFSVSQNCLLDSIEVFFNSSFQLFSDSDRANEFQASNKALASIPGVQHSTVAVIEGCSAFDLYLFPDQVNVVGTCRTSSYSISIQAKQEIKNSINIARLLKVLKTKVAAQIANNNPAPKQ